jgi:hypothetical protein
MNLQQLIESFQDVDHGRVKRDATAYADTLSLTTHELTRLLTLYKQGGGSQRLRLLRDSMDHWIRRYHGYTIGGSIGTHYRQQALAEKGIFEHVIPASKLRDMVITGALTINQALHAPICRISQHNDRLLRSQGQVSSSDNYWNFFRRYQLLDHVIIETHDGAKTMDLQNWTLEDHYKYFGIT